MFIGCSWAWLEQYGPGLNAGSVCVCLCISVHVCMRVGAFLRVREEEQDIGLIRTKA